MLLLPSTSCAFAERWQSHCSTPLVYPTAWRHNETHFLFFVLSVSTFNVHQCPPVVSFDPMSSPPNGAIPIVISREFFGKIWFFKWMMNTTHELKRCLLITNTLETGHTLWCYIYKYVCSYASFQYFFINCEAAEYSRKSWRNISWLLLILIGGSMTKDSMDIIITIISKWSIFRMWFRNRNF